MMQEKERDKVITNLSCLTTSSGTSKVDGGLFERPAKDVGVGSLGQQPVDSIFTGIHTRCEDKVSKSNISIVLVDPPKCKAV